LGMQAAGGVQDALLGLALEGHNDQRQLKQQGKLLKQQAEVDRRQTEFNQQIGLDTWRKTGPVAMTKELKEAGLSPALQYGMGGAGGITTGSGGGSVQGAKAPAGGGEVMGLQMMNAKRALIEAQTENVKADTKKKGGESLELEIANTMAAETYEETYEKIINMAKQVKAQTAIIQNNREISDETKHIEISLKEGELIGLGLSNEMKETGIKLTEEQIKQTIESVKQAWKSLDIQEQNAVINGNRLELDKFIKDVPDSIKLTVETVRDVVGDVIDFKQKKRSQDHRESEADKNRKWNERERTSTQSKRWGRGWSETEKRGNH